MNTNPLNNIKIASPCPADWNQMIGDERKRFCGSCNLNVYNLSGMSQTDAESLLMNSEGRLCVRFFRRADGTVLTKDCPVGWAKVKQRVSRTATAAFGLIAGLFGGLFAFSSIRTEKPTTMGKIAATNVNATMGDYAVEPNQQPETGAISVPMREVKGEAEVGKMEFEITRRKR
jgi:hypothetical protein